MATDSASTSPPPRPPPRRERRRSPSEERVQGRGGARYPDDVDHGRERRRKRYSRSPADRRSKHSRRPHRGESKDGLDEERTRRRKRDDSREDSRRKRSLSRSRDERDRSRSASRGRHPDDRRRRHRDRSGSPTRSSRKDKRSERSVSPRPSRRTGRGRSRSRSPKRRKPSTSASPPPRSKRSTKPLPSQEDAYTGGSASGPVDKPVEKEKPNFNQTGLLARETNTVAGTNVVLKYNEPPDARKPPPRDDWRLYIFKGKDLLHTLELGSRSCWLIGREPAVADLLVEHPSTSKQHAVLQFRYTTRTNEFGDKKSKVRPYLIDLESSNGTFLNGKKLEATRFVEVMAQDMIKFGQSEREYVLMLAPA